MMSGRVSPSESEDEEDIYSDCLVSLSSDGGSRGITILPGGLKLPRLRRRPSGKRQAPQPPRRPAPTSTPAPQSPPDTTTPAPSSPPDTTTPAPSSPPDTTTLAPQSPPDTTTPAPSSPPDTTIPAPPPSSPPTLPVTTSLTPPSSSELLATVTLEDNTTATPDITPTPSLSTTPIPSLSTTPTPSLSTTPIPSLSTTPTPSLSTTPTPSLSTTPTPSPVPTPTPSPTPPITTVQMVLKPDSSPVSDMAPISTTSPSISTTSSTIPQSVEAPPPPPRSASVGATRNMMIRLIDDDSDSESVMSDYFEDHIVFPPRPSPLPYSPPVVVTQTPLTSPTYLPRPPMSPPIVPPGGVVSGGVVTRGRARRLMHSNSDPGLPRAPRPLYSQEQYPRLPQYSQEQYPRLPQSHYPQLPRPQFPPPPLELVSEEEGEDDGSVPHRGTGLRRTSSTMTVGSLREELLVTPGILKLRLTLTNITVMTLVAAFALPHASILLYTGFRLVFGTLFPAYYSYKAVKTKNVKEYVKWMMYWIVFAFFTCFETLTDLFISFWFPFYYELKILVVLWLLSPATRGSSILYRKFVHPWLARREEDIDQCIAQARQQGYSTVVQLGTKGVNYATTVLMQTAIKASRGGGGLMNQLRRSYSQSELVGSDDADMNRNVKALPPHLHGDPHYADYALDHHTLPQDSYDVERRVRAESDAAYKPRGSSASRGVRNTKTRSADVSELHYNNKDDVTDDGTARRRSPRTSDAASRVLSVDDLTSGYSSGDPDPHDLTLETTGRGGAQPDPYYYDARAPPDAYEPRSRTDTYDMKPPTVAHNPRARTDSQDTFGPIPNVSRGRGGKVRRTQSLSASTLALHRGGRGEAGRLGLRSGQGGSSGAGDDPGAPHASYSGPGQGAAAGGHQGTASFRRSRPGEISAYATLPRAATKRSSAAAAAKKRPV